MGVIIKEEKVASQLQGMLTSHSEETTYYRVEEWGPDPFSGSGESCWIHTRAVDHPFDSVTRALKWIGEYVTLSSTEKRYRIVEERVTRSYKVAYSDPENIAGDKS